eukprot:5958248-Prymnesium_polylepis.1
MHDSAHRQCAGEAWCGAMPLSSCTPSTKVVFFCAGMHAGVRVREGHVTRASLLPTHQPCCSTGAIVAPQCVWARSARTRFFIRDRAEMDVFHRVQTDKMPVGPADCERCNVHLEPTPRLR